MDSNRIPTSSYYYPRKATDNFLRLCRLITELCRDLLRIVLCHYIRPPDLRTELDNNRTRLIRILNAKAKKQIYPATGNPTLPVKDFDISTLYILLRNICNLPQHQNGWGNEPTRGDNSIAACIERIRCQRNEYVHSTGTVEDTNFQNSWSELRDAIVEIERQLIGGDLFQKSTEFLLNCDICIVQRGMTQMEDKSVQDTSGTFYDDCGRSIKFANLFNELSGSIPQEKIHQLKDLIQYSCKIGNIAGLKNAISARDCLAILTEAKLFNSKDVICMQYLMKKIECEELFTKCYEYAEEENVLCFHEKPLENGCENAYFHVNGDFEDYEPGQIEKIKATVAAIVGCSSDEIFVGGIHPSSSFLLALSINNDYVGKLLEIGQEDKAKLIKLNIDYFIVDLTIVHLECLKENVWNIYYAQTDISFSKDERIHYKKEQPTMPSLQEHSALPIQSKKDFGDSIIDTLGTFYDDCGRSIKFANLFNELSGSIPQEKIHRLKDLIQYSCKIGNIAGLKNAISARDCLAILTEAKLFNSKDVICMQYLMKKIECEELFTKCYEYAEKENVLCFHEKPQENGCKNAYFHVHGDFKDYEPGQIEKIKATVAAIVGCSSDEIFVGEIHPSERVDKLEETADCSPSKRKKTSKERVDKLEETADCSPSKRKKTSKGDLSSVPLYLKSPALELSIDVPDMLLIHHITSIKSDRLWLGGISYKKEDILKQVDSSGNVIETINDADISWGNFAMTQKGELLYLEKGCNKVQKKTPKGTTTIITTSKDENIRALFSSQITGDLLVGVHKFQTKAGKLTRYDKTGAKIQDIEVDNHGKTLYSYPVYIAENRNGDIVTVDSTKNKVVLVDKLGGYRDYYKGQSPKKREFNPHGVCTDVHGHIMVVDYSSGSIHLLDQDLHFLTLLMTKEQHNLKSASALFVDEKHHLYVGSENGRINVYKYLKDM